ncbi:MAG: HesA/MoeB/ThiF family protein [Desulfarculaceae bacterium]|nr:HesA/MoeB/ThiF family protein [Desulfarculaceae bacterium]MCF8072044.1 HesA/MoeB/ThiF family protein [Desulfarculaceae bacterium]MCF8101561.1 HesA/MoeB/ThiF family protein [Desulfarculaceae bacterium]MCF8115111.1 HesA/MoeB/ThiF family protein [Desulfarculaceae bacterium]
MAGRYAVQERFAPLGPEGQIRLAGSMAVVVGVGALGGHSAQLLARAGVGRLRLVDPDRPTLDNLHRQVLYDELDVAAQAPKVEAAAARLSAANSGIAVEPVAEALEADNAARLLDGASVVLDGLDNPAGRYVLNRACVSLGIPWVHAGLAGSSGQLLVVRPGKGPCLQCWAPEEPREPLKHSVATHGVLGPLPAVLGALQANEAIKLLAGAGDALLKGMLLVELWPPRFRELAWPGASAPCPACGSRF